MRSTQKGVSLGALLGILAVLLVGAMLGLKLAPSYIEYGQIKKTVATIAQTDSKGSVADIRKSFERFSTINDISSITAQDLDISKDGGEVVIGFAYTKKIPLFGNISLLIDFAGSSKA